MKKVLVVLFLFASMLANSQYAYINTYGGLQSEEGKDIVQTVDGGFFALGSTSSNSNNNNSQVYLVKLDTAINFEWSRVYGNATLESGQSIVKTADDNYLILANALVDNDYQIKLYKIDNNGDVLWDELYGGTNWDFGTKIISTDDGFLIVGNTYSMGAGQKDAYMIKINADGEVQWEKAYGGQEDDSFQDIAIDGEGNIIAVGKSNSFSDEGYDEAYYSKIDPVGDTLWTRTFSYNLTDTEANGIAISPSNMMMVGSTYTENKAWQMMHMLVDNTDGTITSYHESGNSPDDYFNDVIYYDDNYYIVGETESYGSGGGDFYFFKTNINADWDGSPTYGNTYRDYAKSLIYGIDNQILGVGTTQQYLNNSSDVMVVKIEGTNFFLDPNDEIYNLFLDETVSISENWNEKNSVTCYPNPFNNNLSVESDERIYAIEIITLTNKIVLSKNNLSQSSFVKLNTKNIPSGVFVLVIRGDNNQVIARQKMVKY